MEKLVNDYMDCDNLLGHKNVDIPQSTLHSITIPFTTYFTNQFIIEELICLN